MPRRAALVFYFGEIFRLGVSPPRRRQWNCVDTEFKQFSHCMRKLSNRLFFTVRGVRVDRWVRLHAVARRTAVEHQGHLRCGKGRRAIPSPRHLQRFAFGHRARESRSGAVLFRLPPPHKTSDLVFCIPICKRKTPFQISLRRRAFFRDTGREDVPA